VSKSKTPKSSNSNQAKHDMKFTAPRTLGRVHLSIQQKIDVVKFYKDENGSPAEAIKRFAHCRLKYGAAKNLFKKCKWEDILSMEGSKGLTKTFRSTKTSTYPVLEKILLKYTNAIREGGLPLSFNGIKSIAAQTAINLYNAGHAELSELEKRCLRNFTASNGYVTRFIKRNCLQSVLLHGKDGSCPSSEEVQAKMTAIRTELENYDAAHIFNVDETGLFFRMLPRRTYIFRHTNKRTVRGTAQMSAKDRLTAIVCTNAVGDKVPIVCIGKPRNARIFRTVDRLPCSYYSQQKAWSTGTIFRKWYTDVFLPFVRSKYPGKKVVLLMDNCGSHEQDLFNDPFGQVKVLFLPQNTTSRFQPMDAGIISNFKTNYRYGLLYEVMKWISVDIGEDALFPRLERRPMPKQGYRGIQDGKPPNILEALTLMVAAWDKIIPRTVVRCWLKTTVLPANLATPLEVVHGKNAAVAPTLPRNLAQEIVDVVQNADGANADTAEKNMLHDMRSVFHDADTAIKAFNEYVAVDDDPDIGLVLENEVLEGVQTGLLDLSIADTGEEHEKDEEHIPAQNYYEMLQYFDDLIRLGKNDTALTYKLRNLRIQFAKDHKPRQKQQRLSVVWACEESCEEQSESRMV
jgi:hypothetical protein